MADSSQTLFAHLSTRDGVVHARLVGPNVGEREIGVVVNLIQEALDAAGTPKALVLDFRDVSFLNSSGIGGCVDAFNRAKKRGAPTILHALRPEIAMVVKATRLDKLFRIADDEKRLAKELKKL